MNNQERMAIAIAAVLAATSGAASADGYSAIQGVKPSGYVLDSQGVVVRNSTGLCWHTGYFTKELAIPECDKDLVPPPPPPPPAPVKHAMQEKLTFGSDELFDFDKATLKQGAIAALDDLVTKLKSVTVLNSVTITGHTDGIGSVAYNEKLSERRADTVRKYLVDHGVPADKIRISGKGKSQPIADNKTQEGRAKNRRVEVEVDGYKIVEQ
jgi:OOP family OmpA-OmpF porin